MRRARLVLTVVAALAAGCAGDAVPTSAGPTVPVEVPTTYVVIDTGPFAGSIEGGGSISFEVREVGDAPRPTLADGQVVVYDYELTDLVATVDLAAAGCEGGGPVTVRPGGSFSIGAGGEVGILGGGLRLEGTVHRSAAGLLWLDLPVDGEPCAAGPLSWSADPAP
jgi:hypothetical protein